MTTAVLRLSRNQLGAWNALDPTEREGWRAQVIEACWRLLERAPHERTAVVLDPEDNVLAEVPRRAR